MKIINEKILVEARNTKALEFDEGGCRNHFGSYLSFLHGYREGAEAAESLLLPKMVEFAEWLRTEGRVPDSIQPTSEEIHGWTIEYDDERGNTWNKDFKTTAQLLDIWIDSNKTPAAK